MTKQCNHIKRNGQRCTKKAPDLLPLCSQHHLALLNWIRGGVLDFLTCLQQHPYEREHLLHDIRALLYATFTLIGVDAKIMHDSTAAAGEDVTWMDQAFNAPEEED